MRPETVYQKIPLDKIDMGNRSFSLFLDGDDHLTDELRRSIARFGIIHPPLLLPIDNIYIIVTGRKRLRASKEILGKDHCSCLVLDPATPSEFALALALEDILICRKPSPLEEALCWEKAVEMIGDEASVRFGPRLEITGKLSPAKQTRLLDLERDILVALHNGEIGLKVASRLMDVEPEGRKELFSIITALHLSHSNQRKLIDQCLELNKRYGQPVAKILAAAECRKIIDYPETNPPQKTAQLMAWLNSLYYPRLTEAEKNHRKLVSSLALPTNVSLAHAPSFEKDSLKMTVEFRDRSEFEKKWQRLKDII